MGMAAVTGTESVKTMHWTNKMKVIQVGENEMKMEKMTSTNSNPFPIYVGFGIIFFATVNT